jgi:HEPN domain-containing protein
VNYYELAEEEIEAVETLFDAGKYRHAVYHSCIAIELLLKTKLVQIEPTSALLEGHDIINIFKALQEKYESSRDLRAVVRFCRKYFNESRYPVSGTAVYTKEFAEQFTQYVEDTKYYVDNECAATVDDLKDRFKKL